LQGEPFGERSGGARRTCAREAQRHHHARLVIRAVEFQCNPRFGNGFVVPAGTQVYPRPTIELVKAGVLLDGMGLQSSAKGARVRFSKGQPTVVDGPFAESKELIAGFWLIQVRSKEEATEWAKRVPFDPDVHMGGEGEIELRQVFELEDFGESEAVDKHRELSKQVPKNR
jgi:hypothetical protein